MWLNIELADFYNNVSMLAQLMTILGATAADAIVSGFRTILLDDCCRGVDLLDIEKTKENITRNHGIIATSEDVPDLVKGNDRRPELGYKLALNLSKRA